MTNEVGATASALAETIGDGISQVRVLDVPREAAARLASENGPEAGRDPEPDPEPEPEIEEILTAEEFEALLLDGSPTSEPSPPRTPAPPVYPATVAPAAKTDLRSSGTWPRLAPPAPPDAGEELATLRAEMVRLSCQMKARDAYLQELERALESNRRELALAGLSTGFHAARLFGRMRGQAFRIAELETDLRQAQLALATVRSASRAAPVRDDLRSIKGIGPRFAEQLYELGFVSYASIANLSADDMVRVATRLRISSDRIERDSWIEQARSLAANAARSAR